MNNRVDSLNATIFMIRNNRVSKNKLKAALWQFAVAISPIFFISFLKVPFALYDDDRFESIDFNEPEGRRSAIKVS
jgi:hypothetical protein